MMLLSLIRKNVKRYWRIARRKKNAKERLNLYDRFCVAEILGGMNMSGLTSGPLATFPSRHYDIELYPAVKRHLLSFGKERLEQTGKTYSINGEKIKAQRRLTISGLKHKTASAIGRILISQKLSIPT